MIPLIPGIVSALYEAGDIGEKSRMKRLIIKRRIAQAPADAVGGRPPRPIRERGFLFRSVSAYCQTVPVSPGHSCFELLSASI